MNSKLKNLVTTIVGIVVMAVIAWIYFYPNDVQGDVLRQSDTLQGVAVGHQTAVYQQETGIHSWWTNALFGGMPTFQISPSYKSSTILSWISKIYNLGFPSPVNLLFILMLGFFILMLACDVKWYLAVLGGIAYGFSSYFIILLGAGHIWKMLTLAYIPPTLAGIILAYRGRYLSGMAVTALFGALQLHSNHVQMSYYSMFIVAALAIGFLVDAIRKGQMKRWGIATAALLVAGVLAIASSAPNLLMTYKYSKETMRGGHSELTEKPAEGEKAIDASNKTSGLDRDYITQWSYGKGETLSLLIPNVKGGATIKPEKGDNHLLSLDKTPKAQKMAQSGQLDGQTLQVLSQFPQYFGDQPMTNGPVYVGILIFALFLLGCAVVKGPVKWALVVVTILAILLSWGRNMMWFTNLFIDYFPMYNKFRTVSSILVIPEITMPLLAVLALKQVFTEDDFFKHHRTAVLVSLGVSALVCLALALVPSMMGTYSATEHEQLVATGQLQQYPAIDNAISTVRHALVSSDAWRSLIFLVLGAAALALYFKNKMNAQVTALVIAGIVLVDMYSVCKRYVNEDSFVTAFDNIPAEFDPRPVDTQILQDKDPNYRVMDVQHFSEAMPSYFHKTVGGYHAAKLARYNDLINNQIAKNNMQVLNMLNTRYFIINDTQAQRNPGALGNAWFVDSLTYVKTADDEMAFLDDFNPAHSAVADAKFTDVLGTAQAVQAGDSIALTHYAPNNLKYHSHSATGGLAVFSEIYFPWGWRATIDGKEAPIGRVNYVLRAMQLPAGDHDIEFTFEPSEVSTTETLATTSLIVILLLVLLAINVAVYRKMRSDRNAEPEAALETAPAKDSKVDEKPANKKGKK